jgi:hypothetical protein
MILLNHMISNRADGDIAIWGWLRDVVGRLGYEGMSSDESSDDDEVDMYHTKRLPWRRNIDKELELIDSLRRKEANAFAPQGSKPIKRTRGDRNIESLRGPRKGLPRAFFDDDWFRGERNPVKAYDVSQVDFQWMNIVVGTGGRQAD